MERLGGGSVEEVVRRVASSLGCGLTSVSVAQFLDQQDELKHLRDEFLLPKIRELPPCESSCCSQTHERENNPPRAV